MLASPWPGGFAPFVFEVRDLWPESILAVEAMKENLIVKGLKLVARYLYNHCDRIVTVGQGYKQEIAARYGINPEKMVSVPNGIDTDTFQPLPRDNAIRKEYGWGEKFVVLYLGTHGMAHALHAVLDTASALRDRGDIVFVFIGEGAEKENLKRRAAEKQLTNVQFIDQQAKQRVPYFYAACDVGLVTLRDTPLFQSVLPSKLFEYLGMERPVIISVGGEARLLVETAGAGTFVPPENPALLAQAVLEAYADRQRLTEMGRQGREYVVKQHDRRALAGRYVEVMAELLPHSSGRHTFGRT